MKPRSLAFRLSAYLGLAWLVLFLILGALVWHSTQRFIEEAETDKARALARQLATVSLDAVLLRDYGTLERYLADLVKEGGLAWAEIQRSDGQVLGASGIRQENMAPLRVPLQANGEIIGQVLAQYDPRPTDRAALHLAGLMALGLATFAGVSFWALRRVLLDRLVAPVAALIAQADPESVARTHPSGQPAEVAALADAIATLRQRMDRHMAEADEAAQSRNEALRRLCSEQRLAAVGQIAGEVAHELNTPLSNILGYAQSVLPLAEDAELREALETIESQARRAGQIVRDMLTAARAPAPSLQDTDLAALAAGFTRLVASTARKQGCTLVPEAETPLEVRADPARVEQILFNLTFNALQAGAKEVRIMVTEDGLMVADDGPGLPATVRERLFEPFVTTKPAGQGTGLGLAICQRLAREMGAELAWIATPAGCCFRLSFPACRDLP